MGDLWRRGQTPPCPLPDFDDVEAVAIPRQPESDPPEVSQTRHDGLLSVADRFRRPAEAGGPAGFDLDEGNQAAKPGDDVQIVVTQTESVGLDFPAELEQVGDVRLLSRVAAAMAGVGPFGDGLGGATRSGSGSSIRS